MSHRLVWALVSLIVIATFGSCVWALAFVGDTLYRQHSGRYPDHPITNTRPLIEFREFPVYWLGPEYVGLPLTQLHIAETGDSVTLGYGYCTWTGGLMAGRSCDAPLEIRQQRPCEWFKFPNTPTGDPSGYFGWGEGVGVEVGRVGDAATAVVSDHQIILDLQVANSAYFPSQPLQNSTALRDSISAQCAAAPARAGTATP